MAPYFYLLAALFLILIFGLKTFCIIIVCGIIGGIGNAIWKAKLEADKEKLQEKRNNKIKYMGVFSDDPSLDAAMFCDFTSDDSGGSYSSGNNGGCSGCLGILVIIGIICLAVSKCTSSCSHDKTNTKYECADSDSIVVAEDTVSYDSLTDTNGSYKSSSNTYHYTGTSSYLGDYDDEDEDYDEDGYDSDGYDRHGYDRNGYDRDGYDEEGYDEEGIDEDGYDEDEHYTGDW